MRHSGMLSSRPYRKGLPFEEAIRRLLLGSGTNSIRPLCSRFCRSRTRKWAEFLPPLARKFPPHCNSAIQQSQVILIRV
jgi:hypothetical protein